MTGSPLGLAVRPLGTADLPEALDLWVRAWQAAYPSIDFAARRAWFAERIAELERTGSRVLIASRSDKVLGLLIVHPDSGYLDQITVAPEAQGKGVADLLLAEARRLSPAGLDLHVNQDNARALRFYLKHGFAIAGEDVNPNSGRPVHRMIWRP